MYFPRAAAFVLVALPFLIGAVPVQNSTRSVRSIPLSKRLTLSSADGVVDVQNLQASVYHTIAKFEQGSKTFKRNTGKPHPLVSREALQNTTSNSSTISLTDYHGQNYLWYGNISVGSPGVTYTVAFDTGTGNFFLPSTGCSNCVGHKIYHPAQSSTAKNLGSWYTYIYGGDQVSGLLLTDTVVVGGFEAANLTLLAALNYSHVLQFPSFGADGVIGMGLKESATFNAPALFETLVDQGQINEPIFGFYLAESDSELIIGGRDSSRYSGDLTYVNVVKGVVKMFNAVSVNGDNILVSNPDVIIDTATSLIIGDEESISNIYAGIPGSTPKPNTNLWTIPCNTNVTVAIDFGGTMFNISPKIYILGDTSGTTCTGGFSTMPTYLGHWVFGDVFLRNVYTEFDYGNLRVGFAQLANKQ